MTKNEATGETSWSLIGLEPAIPMSWARHTWTPEGSRGLFPPLYDYRHEGNQSVLSIGGVSHLAIYRQETTPTYRSHRLFPLYSFQQDLTQDVTRTNILLAYQHEQSPAGSKDTFIPLWHYERLDQQHERRFNALGVGNFSLYEHLTTLTGTTDSFFPLYNHSSDLETGKAEFSLLWPLAEYKSRHGVVTSASVLWWLASYEHPDADHSNFHFLGGSKMALVRRITSPRESVFEFNPIVPLYQYRNETEKGTSWDLFGGLVGTYTAKQETRIKLFWLSL
jgi:hypothetical protein